MPCFVASFSPSQTFAQCSANGSSPPITGGRAGWLLHCACTTTFPSSPRLRCCITVRRLSARYGLQRRRIAAPRPNGCFTILLCLPCRTAVRPLSALEVDPVPLTLRGVRASASSKCRICSAAPPSGSSPPILLTVGFIAVRRSERPLSAIARLRYYNIGRRFGTVAVVPESSAPNGRVCGFRI